MGVKGTPEELTRTVTEAEGGRHVECLEVLSLPGGRSDRSLFASKQSIDGGGLPYVGVAHQAYHHATVSLSVTWVVGWRRL